MPPGLEKVALFKSCPSGPGVEFPLCYRLWLPVVVGPQLLRTHWQARLVPGLASCEAWLQLLHLCWFAGQVFRVAGCKAQPPLLQTHCVYWCRLRLPIESSRAGATLEDAR